MRRRMLSLSMAVALVAVPGSAFAQACIGNPVGESHNAITAQVGFPESATSYGASFRHNATGPLSASVGYSMSSYDNVDPKEHGFGGEVNYELPGLSFSACPTVGVSYSRMSDDASSASVLSIPVGVGFGQSWELSPEMSVNPYVVPQWVWMRGSVEAEGMEFSDDDSTLAALFGATLALQRFYFGGGLTWYNEDNVDPVFSLFAGLPF